MAELKQFQEKVDKMVQDQAELKTGISDIKNIFKALGERLAQAESDARVCRDVLRDLVIETRAREYQAQVEAKLSRPANLVFARTNGATVDPASVNVETLTDFINEKFEDGEAPDFAIEPMGNRGSYKLFPETFSPMEGRRICAQVLKAVKPSAEAKGKGKKSSGNDIRSRLGLNVFYDNPVFLREIRSNTLRLTAQMLQDQGLTLARKPYVKRDILMLDDIPMFPEYLTPTDEGLWPSCFKFLGDVLRNPPAQKEGIPPVAQSVLADLFVAGKGMLFPTVSLSSSLDMEQ
jgi:hypothetical protein